MPRIALAYNARTEEDESQAERFQQEYVDQLLNSLSSLGHEAVPVEVSGPTTDAARRLLDAEPNLVFNLAEGEEGPWREATFPVLYQALGLPYTGSGAEALYLAMDKRLLEEVLQRHGVRVPRGGLVVDKDPSLPEGLEPPILLKPNYEGSSIGIHQDSVIQSREEAQERLEELVKEYPEGIVAEEYIEGREIAMSYLAGAGGEGGLLEPLEYRFPGREYAVFDYEAKSAEEPEKQVEEICPAPLEPQEREDLLETCKRAFGAMRVRDFARADIRLRDDGTPVVIEVNPLPGLRLVSPFVHSAQRNGLSLEDILDHVLRSAARRHGLAWHEVPVP